MKKPLQDISQFNEYCKLYGVQKIKQDTVEMRSPVAMPKVTKSKIQNIVITTLSVYPGMLYQLLKINIFTTSQNSINKNASLFEKYIFFIITMQ